MRSGAVHDQSDVSINGGLAIFCPACPQIDVNISDQSEWKEDDRCRLLLLWNSSNGFLSLH